MPRARPWTPDARLRARVASTWSARFARRAQDSRPRAARTRMARQSKTKTIWIWRTTTASSEPKRVARVETGPSRSRWSRALHVTGDYLRRLYDKAAEDNVFFMA